MPIDLHPASSIDVHAFMALYRRLCPTVNDEASGEVFRARPALADREDPARRRLAGRRP